MLPKILPDLANFHWFVPTPVLDGDHFLSLSELLQQPYNAPDSFLPDNPTARVKPTICSLCDTVCTSQKDFFKHRRFMHRDLEKIIVESSTNTVKTGKSVNRKSYPTAKSQNVSDEDIVQNHKKTPKKSSLKRSRSPKEKSPEESSPRKKVCFSATEEGEDELHDDEDQITAEELDFFHGSTTFGRQVRELGGKKTRKGRRNSS